MKSLYYENTDTNEMVYEEDWKDYAMKELGIKIQPKGKGDTYTKVQVEFMEEFTDWFFSDSCWVKRIEDEDHLNFEREYEMAEMQYEYNLERRLLGEI